MTRDLDLQLQKALLAVWGTLECYVNLDDLSQQSYDDIAAAMDNLRDVIINKNKEVLKAAFALKYPSLSKLHSEDEKID